MMNDDNTTSLIMKAMDRIQFVSNNNLDVLQDGTNAQHRYLMSLQQALDQTKDHAAGISNNYLFF